MVLLQLPLLLPGMLLLLGLWVLVQ